MRLINTRTPHNTERSSKMWGVRSGNGVSLQVLQFRIGAFGYPCNNGREFRVLHFDVRRTGRYDERG